MMLVHIGQPDIASRVHNAWLKTMEDGIHTYDIFKEGVSKQKVGTKEFAQAVVARLGQLPETLKVAKYAAAEHKRKDWTPSTAPKPVSELVGVDLYMGSPDVPVQEFGDKLKAISEGPLELLMIDNRGTIVWPGSFPETFLTDSFRCRFQPKQGGAAVTQHDVIGLMQKVVAAGHDIIKTETLRNFDGKAGYTLAQGQ
jgi:isocitrate dehydrogenase